MYKYETKEIKLDDLYLDEKNPRFITAPNPSQQSIIDYLIEYEEVEQLALDINQSGTLFAGERVIAIEENEKYVVLEGNRRICACKILNNPTLLKNKRPASIGKIIPKQTTLESISIISVDVMNSRIEAQSSLAAKHIDGIKKWSTISKNKFFALEFDNNKSINEIEAITGVSQNKIKTGLKEYRIIEYVLNLDKWTQEEKREYLNLQEIKITRLTRLFSAKTNIKGNPKLRELLQLGYDDKFNLTTGLSKEQFDEILYIVARAAFVPDYCPEFEGTRSTYEDIPQLMIYLEKNNLLNKNDSETIEEDKREQVVNTTLMPTDKQDVKSNTVTIDKKDNEKDSNNDGENKNDNNKSTEDTKKNNNSNKYCSNRNILILDDFIVDCTNVKINNIINELKRINLNNYINSAAVLLRVLIELSVKYYLNNTNNKEKINEKDLRSTVNSALLLMKDNKKISNPEHSQLISLGNKENTFNIFNGFVHYDTVLPSKDEVIHYFDSYRKMIEICLNH